LNIAIIAIIAAAVAIYISLPFFRRTVDKELDNPEMLTNISEDPAVQKLKTLENQKDTLYSAIKDIEFDFSLGKLSADDFQELNTKYKIEAAGVLKEIDSLSSNNEKEFLDSKIEQEILSYRKSRGTNESLENDLEREIAAYRAANKTSGSYVCSQCGAEYGAEDAFCSKCGVELQLT
jgi:uncharacterized protein involved in exopolysaccharide biosynthesis